jgi:hypothetical protein
VATFCRIDYDKMRRRVQRARKRFAILTTSGYVFVMEGRLDGWGEIATLIHRSKRTAQRWARDQGMPVYHSPGKRSKSRVYAFRSELLAWINANAGVHEQSHEGIAERIVKRSGELSQALNLYRNDFVIRFELQRSGLGVKAKIETVYQIVNGSESRQPYTQEVTIDDSEAGRVEMMSVSVDGAPITFVREPPPTHHHLGYSSYQGRTVMIEPASSGKRYTGLARWVIRRQESDFWYLHCGIATFGVRLETKAPSDFEITPSRSSNDLLTIGQHIDITWKRRR